MSRSQYNDDGSNWQVICWRGAVTSAIRGNRGQQLLREMAEALDAMPVKELIAGALEENGGYCALGVVGAKRGIALSEIDPDEPEEVSKAFNIAEALAREIADVNDEWHMTPDARWKRVRAWVAEQIKDKP